MGDDPRTQFSVPRELLRLAEQGAPGAGDKPDEDAAELTRRPARFWQAARAVGPSAPPTDWRSLGLDALLQHEGRSGLVLLTAAAAVMATVPAAVVALGPRIERSLHAGDGGLLAVVVAVAMAGLASGPFLGLIADRRGRMRVSAAALLFASLTGSLAAVSSSVSMLALFVLAAAVAGSSATTAHAAWLAGTYDPGARGRAFAFHALALPLGGALGFTIVAAAGWRWGLLVALVGLPLAGVMFRLPESPPSDAVAMAPTAQRLRRLRSFLAVTLGVSVLGFAAVGLPILGADYLQHHWHLHLGGRGHVAFLAGLGGFGGLPLGGVLGDRAWSQGPGHVARLLGGALAAFGVLLAVAVFAPSLDLVEAGLALAVLALSVAMVATAQVIAAVAYPAARSLAFGMFGAYGLVFGGLGATVVLDAVGNAGGIRLALGLAGAAAVVSGAVVWLSAGMVADDVAVVDAEVADATRPPKHAGHRGNAALRIHDVDFSYGARQVLFGVDVEVEEGEVAGLLGTNGAGKSTLLRLVSGLDHPSSGTIRIFGRDTTYLEAEQVIGLGVSLLAGGRMSFPALTVAENLRVGGHSIRRQGARLRAAVEEVMALFPVLAERRDQRVGTLSGGEQQMLAVARVLLTRPRLVLIDELSLGLAPKVVEGLLAIVRRVNDEGATVLLVEQSVNLALTLAPHSLFLERGEVRFDGETAELLTRDDLLRPVFLGVQ